MPSISDKEGRKCSPYSSRAATKDIISSKRCLQDAPDGVDTSLPSEALEPLGSDDASEMYCSPPLEQNLKKKVASIDHMSSWRHVSIDSQLPVAARSTKTRWARRRRLVLLSSARESLKTGDDRTIRDRPFSTLPVAYEGKRRKRWNAHATELPLGDPAHKKDDGKRFESMKTQRRIIPADDPQLFATA